MADRRGITGARITHGIDPFPFVALILLVLILIWMAYPAVQLFALVPKEYNEGWNAFVAMRAMGDEALYPQDQTLHVNNYPPLSFYVVGALGSLIGDNVVAGRIVSMISIVAIAAEIAVVVRLLGVRWPTAGFAGLVFIGGLICLDSRYIGTNDPQLLGHAVMLVGLFALLHRRGAGGYVIAALLMVVAGLIKHNLLALPLAVTIWLLLTDRRGLLVWLPAAAAALGGALALLWLVYGAAFFDNMASARSYSVIRMMLVVKHALEPLQVLLIGSALLVVARPRDAGNQLVALYGACGIVIGILLAGGAGTGRNLFFDLLIASSLGSGLLIQQAGDILSSYRPVIGRAVVATAYLVGIALNLPEDPIRLAGSGIQEAQAATRADVDFLAGHAGPAMCETLTLCYWAGKDLEVDAFNARQGFLARGHDQQVLLDLLATRAFAAIQLTESDPGRDDERISKAFMDRLYEHYRPARSSINGDFFVPLDERSGVPQGPQ